MPAEEKKFFTICGKCPSIKSIKRISMSNSEFSHSCRDSIYIMTDNNKIICNFHRSKSLHSYKGSYEVKQDIFENFTNAILNSEILELVEQDESESEINTKDIIYDYETGPSVFIEFNEKLPSSVIISLDVQRRLCDFIERYFVPDLKKWNADIPQ